MKRSKLPLIALTLLLLTGCEALNDALIRQSLKDNGLSGKVNRQIRQGLEKKSLSPANAPTFTAPPFLDQG